jgi:hypothetical protein
MSLEEGSIYANQSAIGVLLHDIALDNALWKAAPVAIAGVEIVAEVATVTTAVPHGFNDGDLVDVHTASNGSYTGNITVVNPGTFTISAFDYSDLPFVADTGEAALAYDDAVDDSDTDGLADDGFGNIQQVYAGPTTFDGKPAFAVTWYRVMSYEDDNDGRLSQTFQIVLVKEATPNGDTIGNSFTIQFNFGTVADNELFDGYDATQPDSECDGGAAPEDCRFAVGIVYYHSATDTATAQELFANVAKADLIDGGAQALVDNSLNSTVAGRYVLSVAAATPTLAATGSDVPLGALGAGLALLVLGGAALVARRRIRSN